MIRPPTRSVCLCGPGVVGGPPVGHAATAATGRLDPLRVLRVCGLPVEARGRDHVWIGKTAAPIGLARGLGFCAGVVNVSGWVAASRPSANVHRKSPNWVGRRRWRGRWRFAHGDEIAGAVERESADYNTVVWDTPKYWIAHLIVDSVLILKQQSNTGVIVNLLALGRCWAVELGVVCCIKGGRRPRRRVVHDDGCCRCQLVRCKLRVCKVDGIPIDMPVVEDISEPAAIYIKKRQEKGGRCERVRKRVAQL